MLGKHTSTISERYYESINEMILDNWFRCQDGNIQYCRKNIKKGSKEEDERQWIKLQDEYLKVFGLQEDYSKFLKLQIDKAKAELDYIISNDRFKLNKISQIEAKIQLLTSSSETGLSVQKVLNSLSKMQGYKMTIFNTTVNEYFELIDTLQKENRNE